MLIVVYFELAGCQLDSKNSNKVQEDCAMIQREFFIRHFDFHFKHNSMILFLISLICFINKSGKLF